MGWFDKLLGRDAPGEVAPVEGAPEVREPQSFVIEAKPSQFTYAASLKAAQLRPSMWVNTEDGIGIITACQDAENAAVTLVKPDGTTKMVLDADDKPVPAVLLCHIADIEQAAIEDIIALHSDKRPAPEVDALLGMGYKHRSAA